MVGKIKFAIEGGFILFICIWLDLSVVGPFIDLAFESGTLYLQGSCDPQVLALWILLPRIIEISGVSTTVVSIGEYFEKIL